jgi:tetratricopeptide (TPR) repeat protein
MVRNARHREEIENERRKELTALGLSPQQISDAWPDAKASIDAIMESYFGEVESLCRGVLTECGKGTAERPSNARHVAMRVLMEIHSKRYDYAQVRRIGKQLLEEYPRAEAISAIHTAIAESYLHEERFADAVEYLREVIAQRYSDPEYVIYNNHYFDALNGIGDIDEMEELAHLMRAEYPTRMSGISSDFLLGQYETWYYNAFFWIGFTRLAQGDPAGALEAFEGSANEVDALASKLAAEGKSLNKVVEIYRVMRTADLIEYLKNEFGKVPTRKVASAPVTASPPLGDSTGAGDVIEPVDFDATLWATQAKATLEASRGKVVMVVFRRTRDARSSRFLQKMDEFAAEKAKDGVVGLTLGFLVGNGSASDDAMALDDMRKELGELGVTHMAAGYDPDRQRQSLFRSLHATVCTASFLVFNKKGEHAWYLADPRSMDVALAKRVIERILAE